jgi:hypothetical protein
MSNIHSANAWHGLDDEPHEIVRNGKIVGFTNKCVPCWNEAKTKFFAGPPRRGRTLAKVYGEVHQQAHVD